MRTAENIVKQEVIYCVSHLVSHLAQQGDEEAMELCYPVQDYESAALEWLDEIKGDKKMLADALELHDAKDIAELEALCRDCSDAQDICDLERLDPHEREIFEHWIVSDWLAEMLERLGERVSYDLHGLTVWGRTTTGQAIKLDYTIEQVAELAQRDYESVVADLDRVSA